MRALDREEEQDLVDARFVGSTYCQATDGTSSGSCLLRIVAKGNGNTAPLQPSTMTDVLDVTNGVTEDNYTLTMEKSRVLPAGSWTITVQHEVSGPNLYFGIWTYHLTLERAPV